MVVTANVVARSRALRPERGLDVTSPDIDQLERKVVEILQQSGAPLPPKELIERIKGKTEFSDAAIRDAIWHLIDRMEIRLTGDRRLEAGEVGQSAWTP
jgi:hypothetical protein